MLRKKKQKRTQWKPIAEEAQQKMAELQNELVGLRQIVEDQKKIIRHLQMKNERLSK